MANVVEWLGLEIMIHCSWKRTKVEEYIWYIMSYFICSTLLSTKISSCKNFGRNFFVRLRKFWDAINILVFKSLRPWVTKEGPWPYNTKCRNKTKNTRAVVTRWYRAILARVQLTNQTPDKRVTFWSPGKPRDSFGKRGRTWSIYFAPPALTTTTEHKIAALGQLPSTWRRPERNRTVQNKTEQVGTFQFICFLLYVIYHVLSNGAVSISQSA